MSADLALARDATLEDWRSSALRLQGEIGKIVLGQEGPIRFLIIAIFARGHVLLEGDVGTGKTTLLRAVARAIGGAFERIEGAVDLMPSDLLYYTHLGADGRPRVDAGPTLRNGEDLSIFFFNEINRARPQVHSLLLRLMAERSIIAFNREHRLPDLQVFADRNRIEKEETFELPAASRDRFFMEIAIETPKDDEIRRRLVFDTRFHDVDSLINEIPQNIVDYRELNGVARAIQDRVRSSEFLQHYVTALWRAVTEPVAAGIEVADVDMERLVLGGASPRGLSYLARAARVRAWLEGRDMIAPEDIRAVFRETMGHRIFLDPIYEMRRESIMPEFCRAVFAKVPAP